MRKHEPTVENPNGCYSVRDWDGDSKWDGYCGRGYGFDDEELFQKYMDTYEWIIETIKYKPNTKINVYRWTGKSKGLFD